MPNGANKKLNFIPKVWDSKHENEDGSNGAYVPIYIAPDATNSVQGDVFLSDSVNGTQDAENGMTAATPKAVAQVASSAKSYTDTVNRAAVKTYPYPNSLGVSNWVHLGDWSDTQDSHTLKIDLLSGDGYNAGTSQNSTVEIFVKDGWQSTASATNAYGATVTLGQLDRSKCHVDVIATSATSCSIWVNIAYYYDGGSYTVAMTPGDTWTHSGAVSSTEPTGTKQNVAFLTNAEEANAAAGAARTSANNAQSTANTAVTNAAKAQSSADAAQSTADDAWSRTLRVQVSSAPADAAGDTSTLTATVWRGGELLSDEAVAKMGLLAWYVGGRRVATGGTYTCAAGTAVECRLEA